MKQRRENSGVSSAAGGLHPLPPARRTRPGDGGAKKWKASLLRLWTVGPRDLRSSAFLCQASRIAAFVAAFLLVGLFLRNPSSGALGTSILLRRGEDLTRTTKKQLPPASDPTSLKGVDMNSYGTALEVGTSFFEGSEACRAVRGGCVVYRPHVDLQAHLPGEPNVPEEDLDVGGVFDIIDDQGGMEQERRQPPLRQQPPMSQRSEVKIMGSKEVPFPPGAFPGIAILTRRGLGIGHNINQDRSFGIQPYLPIDGDKSAKGKMLGLFDGHGPHGHAMSNFVSIALPHVLSSKLSSAAQNVSPLVDDAVKKAFVETFLEVDRLTNTIPSGGCTATVALQLNGKLYFANAGDSLLFVGTYSKSTKEVSIKYRTREDKPDLPEERARVEKAGGIIYIPPAYMVGDSPRVIPGDGNGGPGGDIALAMSRSIGDREVKDFGVIADPIVDVVQLSDIPRDFDVFVVAASDGLTNYKTANEIADRVAASLYGEGTTRNGAGGGAMLSPLVVMEDLIMEASHQWTTMMRGMYRDDITLAVGTIER